MKAFKAKRFTELQEIASYFIRLGLLGFGGPLALMAAFQKDLVDGRRWLGNERFNQALALIKALPGPTATQLAIYLGFIRGGRWGGIVAGTCLILPSFVMMVVLAAFYDSVEALSSTRPVLFGMQSAAIGVILASVWRLAFPYRDKAAFWVVAAVAVTVTFYKPAAEPLVIIGAGCMGAWLHHLKKKSAKMAHAIVLFSPQQTATQALAASAATATATAAATAGVATNALGSLALVSLKAAFFTFGTGLAIVPLLAHDVVDRFHWLSHHQFFDALAFGQITPGPVVITVTFIGYKVAGFAGAIVATVCLFAPCFFNILTWFSWLEKRMAGSNTAQRFVQWAIAAVVGSILVVIGKLALTAPEGGTLPIAWAIAAAALGASLFSKLPVWALIPAGGVVGLLVSVVG